MGENLKLVYSIKAGNYRFTIYYPQYKDMIVINPTRAFVCTVGYLYFAYCLDSLGNLSAIFFFAHDNGTYATELDRITNKEERSRAFYLIFLIFSNHRLFLSD